MMLVLIIPGKESVTSGNIDVYMAPLIEELQNLWDGVHAFDVSNENRNCDFVLKAIHIVWCGAFTISLHMDLYPDM